MSRESFTALKEQTFVSCLHSFIAENKSFTNFGVVNEQNCAIFRITFELGGFPPDWKFAGKKTNAYTGPAPLSRPKTDALSN